MIIFKPKERMHFVSLQIQTEFLASRLGGKKTAKKVAKQHTLLKYMNCTYDVPASRRSNRWPLSVAGPGWPPAKATAATTAAASNTYHRHGPRIRPKAGRRPERRSHRIDLDLRHIAFGPLFASAVGTLCFRCCWRRRFTICGRVYGPLIGRFCFTVASFILILLVWLALAWAAGDWCRPVCGRHSIFGRRPL
jgi:hypothetical protein